MKNKIRKFILNKLGYWFYKTKHLPVGTDLFVDLKFKVAQPINVVFDVGANIGAVSSDFTTEFPNVKVYSFEPIESTFDLLKRNLAHLKNIKTFQIAFGEQQEKIEIELNPESYSPQNSLLNKANNTSEKTEVIDVRTIDVFVKENGIDIIDFLKIDTEGYEEKVLRGAEKTISSGKIKMIYLEVGFSYKNKNNSNFLSLYKTLEEFGYSFFGLYEISQVGFSSNLHYGNVLFIHSSVISKIESWQLK
ncbi:MAG: FkbM family methyltransferase [Brumimicrobium sp.]